MRWPMGISRPALQAARWLLICVFAWTAGSKIAVPGAFAESIGRLGMLPPAWIPWVASAIPATELLLAVLLALGTWIPFAALTSLWLSAIFVSIHAYAVATGTVKPCGCAGIALTFETRGAHLGMAILSIAMGLASLCLLFLAPTLSKTAPIQGRGTSIADLKCARPEA